jgi:hypothetical protein
VSTLIAVMAAWVTGVGLVAFSVAAKLLDWRATTMMWPVTSPRLQVVLGPMPTMMIESFMVAFAIAPVSAQWRLAALGLLYSAYAMAALVLRGRPCACFGRTWVTRFSWGHAAACAVWAAILIGANMVTPSSATATLGAVMGGAIGATAGVAAGWRRWRAQQRVTDPAQVALVDHIVVYGSTGCPGCRGVWAQQDQLAAIAACPVDFQLVEDGQAMKQVGGVIPAAVGYDSRGTPVYGPVVGLTAIRNLLVSTTRTAVRP